MTLFDEPLRTGAADARDAAPLVRLKLVVAYDGSAFHGFAVNRGVSTVAGTLEQALELVLRHPVTLTGAGRTDRGVHAWGQVVSFDTPVQDIDLSSLRQSVNKLCGGSIVVRDAEIAPPSFDARFSATSRVYRYTVLNEPVPDPFMLRTAWWVEQPLDLRSMRLGCDPFIGEHDFSSFCRRPKPSPADGASTVPEEPSLVRRVIDARWSTPSPERDRLFEFEIEAKAFCHQMVRSIVGTLVEVGSGRKRAGDMTAILRARTRQVAGQLAPPRGLCLWRVRYETP
jgi:tRNA pseudouridine38-40 synthase